MTEDPLVLATLEALRTDIRDMRTRYDERLDEVFTSLTGLHTTVTALRVASSTNRGWVRSLALNVVAPLAVAGLTAVGALMWAGVIR